LELINQPGGSPQAKGVKQERGNQQDDQTYQHLSRPGSFKIVVNPVKQPADQEKVDDIDQGNGEKPDFK